MCILYTFIVCDPNKIIKSFSWVVIVCERKKGYSVFNYRSMCLGLVTMLLNCLPINNTYLLSVNVLFSGMSSRPSSCLQMVYLSEYRNKCLGSTLMVIGSTVIYVSVFIKLLVRIFLM